MAPAEPLSEVTVKVKIPPGHLPGTNEEVFSLGALSTTHPVSILRQRIQTLVPTNPPPSSQRILYSGRALIDDEQLLRDALNTRRDPAQTDYVVHLLVRNGGIDSTARADHGIAGRSSIPDHSEAQPSAILRSLFPESHNAPGMPQVPRPTNVQFPIHPASYRPDVSSPDTTQSSAEAGRDTPPLPANPLQAHGQVPHRHHHHHHPQPHFHHGPHIHNHGHQAPFPRPASNHGFHISGTGPDGQHFAIHQQTFTTNGMSNTSPLPAIGPSGGLPGFMGLPFPGMPHAGPQPNQAPVFSALERARENMAEMSRMLNTLREESVMSEEHRTRVADIERRMQAVNDYIDPFHLGARNRGQLPSSRMQTPAGHQPGPINPLQSPLYQPSAVPSPLPAALQHPSPNIINDMQNRHFAQQPPPLVQPTAQISVYLLSSPQGPHALLFSPQHGTFSGSLGASPQTLQGPFSAVPLTPAPGPTPTQPAQQDVAAVPQNEEPGLGQIAQAQADPLAMLQPILGHLWLLVRVLIFAYFLMGADMGWRRPVGLFLIGLGFWLIRLGLFGNNGLVRRWWDAVVGVENIQDRMRRHADLNVHHAQNAAPAAGGAQAQADGQGNVAQAAPRPFPTPEELAERLIREQRQNTPLQRLREQIRPAQSALALFIASLWPGVGERYIQALDRAHEEEEAVRRSFERQQEQAARARETAEQESKEAGGSADTRPGDDTDDIQQAGSSSEKKQA